MTKPPLSTKDPTHTHTQKGLNSSAVKLSTTKRQISKVRLEGVDKWCFGNQLRNLGKIFLTSSRISGAPPHHSNQMLDHISCHEK